MKRGDVVTVAAAGDYGRPRPAVIVQTDALPAEHASVVICQMTSEMSDAPELIVAHPLDLAVRVPDHEFRVHLVDLFRDQAVLQLTSGLGLQMKRHRPQRRE